MRSNKAQGTRVRQRRRLRRRGGGGGCASGLEGLVEGRPLPPARPEWKFEFWSEDGAECSHFPASIGASSHLRGLKAKPNAGVEAGHVQRWKGRMSMKRAKTGRPRRFEEFSCQPLLCPLSPTACGQGRERGRQSLGPGRMGARRNANIRGSAQRVGDDLPSSGPSVTVLFMLHPGKTTSSVLARRDEVHARPDDALGAV